MSRPKIKLRSVEDLGIKQEMTQLEPSADMEFDVAVEEVGDVIVDPEDHVNENGDVKKEGYHHEVDLGEIVVKEEEPEEHDEKPNASLLHSLLLQVNIYFF